MRLNSHSWILSILIVVLLFAAGTKEVFAFSEGASGSEIVFTGQKPSDIQEITYPYVDTTGVAYTWTFPYSDEFFDLPSDEFSIDMAQGSLGLAVSAFRSDDDSIELQYETYLTGAGFSDLYSFGYDEETSEDSLSGVIGRKKIGGSTVIAAVTCGEGYGKEWASNFKVGKDVRHQGFDSAASRLENYISDYIDKYKIKGKKKLWVTGFSRAGAIANLTAADLIEGGEYEDVYAYLFAVPRTTKEPVAYDGIYNICGQFDPVPELPLGEWGYGRYGKMLFTPSQEGNDDYYPDFWNKVNEVWEQMAGSNFRNYPEINYQLDLLIGFMGEFFSTSDDYADRLQDEIVDAIADGDMDQLLDYLKDAMEKINSSDSEERRKKDIFVDYLSYLVGQHVSVDHKQIDTGHWDPDESIKANVALEHRPAIYVSWLFSDIANDRLFYKSVQSHRLVFWGDISIEVIKDGSSLATLDQNGVWEWSDNQMEESEKTDLVLPVTVRNGSQTLMRIPFDAEYTLKIKKGKNAILAYTDLIDCHEKTTPEEGEVYFTKLGQEDCYYELVPGKTHTGLTESDGDEITAISTSYEYLPSNAMEGELSSLDSRYLTLRSAIKVLVGVLCLLLIVFIVSIVIFFLDRKKRRQGQPPFPDWFVIVPHLIYVFTFICLTYYVEIHLYSIPVLRAFCAAAAMVAVFFLAGRAFLRYKNVFTGLILLITLAVTVWLYLNYSNAPFSKNLLINFMVLVLGVLVLTILTVIGYLKGRLRNR